MITDEVSDDVAVQLAALWRLEKSARRKRIRFVPQHHEMDCAAACLETVVQTYGRRAGLARCRAVVRDGRDGASLRDLQIGAEALGLECLGLRNDFSTDLQDIPLPVVVGVEHHFVVVYGTSKGVALVMDPALGKTQMSLTELTEKSSGICLAMAPTAAFWEWPEIRPDYRRYTALLARHWKVLTVAFLCIRITRAGYMAHS